MVEVMDRCPSGIIGFDRMCRGGFIRNSVNLIVGGPGSGKSTFLLKFLWEGVTKFGENGIYCSFEPDIIDTLNDGMNYGWDFTRLSNEGRIKFLKFSPHTSIDELKRELTSTVSKNHIKRICFDPISIVAMNLSDQGKIREMIFELTSLMKRLKVTTLLADESLEGDGMTQTMVGEWTKSDVLRFLSDSVTILYETGIAGKEDRAVRITKMRRTNHFRKPAPMKIADKGIEVLFENPNDEIKKAHAKEVLTKNEEEIKNDDELKKQKLLEQQELQRQQLIQHQQELQKQQLIRRQQELQNQKQINYAQNIQSEQPINIPSPIVAPQNQTMIQNPQRANQMNTQNTQTNPVQQTPSLSEEQRRMMKEKSI